MSYFVLVTFDLHSAKSQKYAMVKRELAKIEFNKYVVGRKKTPTQLPHNTYVAVFDNDDFEKSAELTKFVVREVRRIFREAAIVGVFFVSAGRGWAWRRGSVLKLGRLVGFSRLTGHSGGTPHKHRAA